MAGDCSHHPPWVKPPSVCPVESKGDIGHVTLWLVVIPAFGAWIGFLLAMAARV